MAGLPAKPLAKASTVSLVLMSPSTVIRLKLEATASFSAACNGLAAMSQSVVMKHSIVACRPAGTPPGTAAGRAPVGDIPGWIIPAPLHIPPMRTTRPPILSSIARVFGRESLVMMASAAWAACSGVAPSTSAAASMPAATCSMGICTPMRPVDPTSTRPVDNPRAFSARPVIARASFMP